MTGELPVPQPEERGESDDNEQKRLRRGRGGVREGEETSPLLTVKICLQRHQQQQ